MTKKRIQSRRFEPTKYPYVFQQVLQHFEMGAGSRPLTFEFDSEAKAHQIRFTWYNFVRSLHSHGHEKNGAIADGVIVKKRDNVLIFAPRDDEPDFASMEEQMRAQLGGALPEMPVPQIRTRPEDQAHEMLKGWLDKPEKSDKEMMDELFGEKKDE